MSIHMRDLSEAVLDLLYCRPTEPELDHEQHLLIQAYRSGPASEAACELARCGQPNPDGAPIASQLVGGRMLRL